MASRILNTAETDSFRDYQRKLSLFTLSVDPHLKMFEFRGSGEEQLDAPLVPGFCNGLDDSVEVVLSSCFVRVSLFSSAVVCR